MIASILFLLVIPVPNFFEITYWLISFVLKSLGKDDCVFYFAPSEAVILSAFYFPFESLDFALQ